MIVRVAIHFKKCFISCYMNGASQVVLAVKNLPDSAGNAREVRLIPGLERSPGVGNDTPLQNSWLQSSIGRGSWQATAQGAAKSQT